MTRTIEAKNILDDIRAYLGNEAPLAKLSETVMFHGTDYRLMIDEDNWKLTSDGVSLSLSRVPSLILKQMTASLWEKARQAGAAQTEALKETLTAQIEEHVGDALADGVEMPDIKDLLFKTAGAQMVELGKKASKKLETPVQFSFETSRDFGPGNAVNVLFKCEEGYRGNSITVDCTPKVQESYKGALVYFFHMGEIRQWVEANIEAVKAVVKIHEKLIPVPVKTEDE